MATHSEEASSFKLFTGLVVCFRKSVSNLAKVARNFDCVDQHFFVVCEGAALLILLQLLREACLIFE